MAIIDQHVAHERVLFEQVMERLTAGRLESQRLLTPILLELSPAQRQALMQHAATLERFGLELEEFGGDSVRLSAVPALLDPAECEAAVRALAEDLEGLAGGARRRGRAAQDRRDDGVPRRGEGELPADAREDALHPRGAAPHGVLERLPARPSGRAADHAGGKIEKNFQRI